MELEPSSWSGGQDLNLRPEDHESVTKSSGSSRHVPWPAVSFRLSERESLTCEVHQSTISPHRHAASSRSVVVAAAPAAPSLGWTYVSGA